MKEVKALVPQSCLILCDPVYYSPPFSSVHGILQARLLEWVAVPFSRGSSQPRDWPRVSSNAGIYIFFFFTIWAIIEAPIKLIKVSIWSDKDCVPGGSDGKESVWNVGDLGSIPGLGKSPRERNGYPLQYSCLENSMDCIVQGVAKSQTWLSNLHFHFSRILYAMLC